MNSFVQADIFFFITSIAVLVVTLALLIILIYGIKIARTVSEISQSIKKQSDEILTDIQEFREQVKSQSTKVSTFWKFVSGFVLNRAVDVFMSKKNKKHSRAQHGPSSSHATKKKTASEKNSATLDTDPENVESDTE